MHAMVAIKNIAFPDSSFRCLLWVLFSYHTVVDLLNMILLSLCMYPEKLTSIIRIPIPRQAGRRESYMSDCSVK